MERFPVMYNDFIVVGPTEPVEATDDIEAAFTQITEEKLAFISRGDDSGTDKKEKKMILEELKTESRTMILYEAPHHLIRTLEELYAALGARRITLCRELTKKFETVFPTTLEKALDYYKTEEPRGEYVLVVEGKSPEEKRQEEIASWESMSIEEHMAYYEEQGMDNKSAMKQVAKDRGVGKREIYQYLHGNS